MTEKRIIYDENAFYHVMNRVCGAKTYFPFDDVVKQKFLDIMNHLLDFHGHFIDGLSYVILSNHYHLVLAHDPTREITAAEVCRRFYKYYSCEKYPKVFNENELPKVIKRMSSLSSFMGELDRRLAVWFNGTYHRQLYGEKRRGHLWQDKFKSTVIEGMAGVRRCIAYVECNPLRANIVDNPADYHFSSFGAYKGTGRHPFTNNFAKYFLCDKFEDFPTIDESPGRFNRCIEFLTNIFEERLQTERNLSGLQAHTAMHENPFAMLSRRVRYWEDSKIIFSHLKESEIEESINEKIVNARKTVHKFKDKLGETFKVFSWHKLFPDDDLPNLQKS